ncbi:MAG: methyltransferase domain-containing protein [Verrucomicrobiae bacterium]|nr:methyltransferase domain-containing protein [Verrucomicrobiae bacterium]
MPIRAHRPRPLGACRMWALLLGTAGWLAGAPAPVVETNVAPGINQEYTRTNINVERWVQNFERESREIYAQRDKIMETLQLRRGMRVADVGAGSGLFTVLMAQAVGPRGKVYAVDIVPAFLKHIEARAREAGLKQIQTVQATERSSRLPAQSVDLVFICDTYHHFEYPQSTLASLHRALRARGQLVIIDFHRIPGKSSAWTLQHVRAGQEVFAREIEAAGFERLPDPPQDFLKENYLMRFVKRGR